MGPDTREKYLFVASTGGHLAQLARLSVDMHPSEDSVWVTFRTPQSEDLLSGRRAFYVRYVRSRDVLGVVRAWWKVRRLLATEKFDHVVSTGAALALSALPAARLRRIPTTYIESVSRVDGPSLTGKIIALTRTAELRAQHSYPSRRRWKPYPSVFGTYRAVPVAGTATPQLFVTLGTIEGYRFDAAVDAVLATGLADERTVWQVGETTRDSLPGRTLDQTSTEEFRKLAIDSDVVISHAGVGTLLELLELGVYPVVVPRRKRRKEHVDDHQTQIAQLVETLGVGRYAETDDLTADDIRAASSFTVAPIEER